jgi:uncharacterized protein (TIGR02001 family)
MERDSGDAARACRHLDRGGAARPFVRWRRHFAGAAVCTLVRGFCGAHLDGAMLRAVVHAGAGSQQGLVGMEAATSTLGGRRFGRRRMSPMPGACGADRSTTTSNEHLMHHRLARTLLAPALVGAAAFAVPAPADAQLAFNVGAVTDYRYRGISQSRLKPAIQGGADYALGSFYVGAWASTIKWIKDFGGDAGVEIDVYGGYKGEIAKGLGYDVGLLTYIYPSNKLKNLTGANADTTEIYGAMTWEMVTLKYSHAVTNTFGNADSKGSFYFDLSAAFDVGGGFTLTPHLGYQKIKGPFSGPGSYSDYSLVGSKDFSGLLVSLGVYGTDADKNFYASPANGKFLGRTGLVAGVKYSF